MLLEAKILTIGLNVQYANTKQQNRSESHLQKQYTHLSLPLAMCIYL